MSLLWEIVAVSCGTNLLSYAAGVLFAFGLARWLRAHPLYVQRALASLMARVTRWP